MRTRKRILVEGFQAQWVVTLLVWAGVLISVFALVLVGPLAWSVSTGDATDATLAALLLLHQRLWLPLLALFLGLTLVALRMTHGVAGPLYRFRQVFAEVGAGNFAVRTAIRKRDYLQVESRALGAMITSLSTRIEHAQQSVAALEDQLSTLAETEQGGAHRADIAILQAHARAARQALDVFKTATAIVPAELALPRESTITAPVREGGFSLVELLVAMAVITAIAGIALPNYLDAVYRAQVAGAIGDIGAIDKDITIYRFQNGCFPASLADVGHAETRDPWGATYEYGVPQAPGGGRRRGGRGGTAGSCQACGGACIGPGAARKDRNLVPINGDFDLYSKGRDGRSTGPITAGPSLDDVIRGRTGSFVGLAAEY